MDWLARALHSLCPGSEFTFQEQDYSTVEWIILEGNPPSQAQVTAEIARLKIQAASDKAQAQSDRAAILERLGITADEAKLLIG